MLNNVPADWLAATAVAFGNDITVSEGVSLSMKPFGTAAVIIRLENPNLLAGFVLRTREKMDELIDALQFARNKMFPNDGMN